MTLAEERLFLARESEWSTEDTWRSKVRVREQLTLEDYQEGHRLEGTTPCAYATTSILCKDCAKVEREKLRKPETVNPRGRENMMWKGRMVNVLAEMRPLTEMAISEVHVVMQVWALRTSGQVVYSGHVCNLRVKTSAVVRRIAKATRRLQDVVDRSPRTSQRQAERQIAQTLSHELRGSAFGIAVCV